MDDTLLISFILFSNIFAIFFSIILINYKIKYRIVRNISMNPDQSPLPKLNIFQLIGLISPIITCLAAFTLLNIIVGTSNWFRLHSLLFNAGAIDHAYRQRILLDCMQSDFLLPSTSTSTHSDSWQNEELKLVGKIVDHFDEKAKLSSEKFRKLDEERAGILEVIIEIREKQKKLYEEFQKISEEIRQYLEAGQYEEAVKLVEKRKKNDEEHQQLKEAENEYHEELRRIAEECKRTLEENNQDTDMFLQFNQEFRRRLIEEERKRDMHLTCRAQYGRFGDSEYYGDGDSD